MEILAFRLGNEDYALEIGKVQELRGYDAVTALAKAPDFIKGVINLRGVIVPIIDMRLKFKCSQATYDRFTVVIVLNVAQRTIGMVVDSVSDVVTLDANDIKPAPGMGTVVDTAYIIGIAPVDDRMLIVVDIAQLLSSDEIGLLGHIAV
ncbi:chemotaxis protein CheW [Noviherbaspirillum agri]